MTAFLIIAVFMAAIAATAVAWPLLRKRESRLVGAAAGLLVMAAAAGLYPLWSNWNWHEAPAPEPAASPQVLAMVAELERKMQAAPNDIKGWLLLGRSDIALERVDDAVTAFQHAHRLDADNVEALLGLGEALSMRAGGNITPSAGQLFERAVSLQPDNPRALLYSGFAAATRGDRAAARMRWLALKALNPPPEIDAMLDQRIAELGTADLAAAGGGPAATGRWVRVGRGDARASHVGDSRRGRTRCGRAIGGASDRQSIDFTGAQVAPYRRHTAVRVCPGTGHAGSAARRQTPDQRGHRHADSSLGGGFHGPRPCPHGGSEGVDHRAGVLQRAAPAGSGRFVRRTYL